MKKKFYTLCRESVELPRTNEGNDEWEFLEGSDYYTREKENVPAKNKSKTNL